MKSIKLFGALFILAFSVVASASSVNAAEIVLSPSTNIYTNGDSFTVVVQVDPQGENINAVGSTQLSFDVTKLSVVSISKTDSVFSLWTMEPTFSNASGTIDFAGGSPEPFVNKSTAITVIFNTIDVGVTNVTVSSSSILAADGLGTDLYSGSVGGVYTIEGNTEVSGMTLEESLDVLLDEGVIDTDKESEARNVLVENPELTRGELVELYIELGIISQWAEEDAWMVIAPSIYVNSWGKNPRVIKVESDAALLDAEDDSSTNDYDRDLTNFILYSGGNLEVLEIPVIVRTENADVQNVVSDVYIRMRKDGTNIFAKSVAYNGNEALYIFRFVPGELTLPDRYQDYRGTLGFIAKPVNSNYLNGETVQASIVDAGDIVARELREDITSNELAELLIERALISVENSAEARNIATSNPGVTNSELVELFLSENIISQGNRNEARALVSPNSEKGGMFVGSAIGPIHELLSEGIYEEILSTESTASVLPGDVANIGNFSIVFGISEVNNDYFLSATNSAVIKYHYEDGQGNVVSTIYDDVSALTSSVLPNGDVYGLYPYERTFTLNTTMQPSVSGFYRLQMDSIIYGNSSENPYGLERVIRLKNNFLTESIFLNTGTPTDIRVPKVTASNDMVFSPNNDGVNDVTTVTAQFSEIVTAKMDILNQAGTILESKTTEGVDDFTFQWEGLDGSGIAYPDGSYTSQFTLTDDSGNTTVDNDTEVIIDTTYPTVDAYYLENSIFSPDGDGVDDNTRGWVRFSEVVPVATVEIVSPGGFTLYSRTWNNVDSIDGWTIDVWQYGVTIPEGEYTLRIILTDAAGNTTTNEDVTVTVDYPVVVELPSGGGGGGGSSRNRSSTPTTEDVLPVVEGTAIPTPVVLGVSAFRFTKDLGADMDNDDVIQLQKLLRNEGFFTYPTNTGYYGSVTTEAVREYQRNYNINPTGYVGPITRAQLNKNMVTPVISDGSMSDLEILILLVDLLKQVQVLQSQLDARNATGA